MLFSQAETSKIRHPLNWQLKKDMSSETEYTVNSGY